MRTVLTRVSAALRWRSRAGHVVAAGLLLLTNPSELAPIATAGLLPDPVDLAEPFGVTGGSTLYLEPPPVPVAIPPVRPRPGTVPTASASPLDGLGIPVTMLDAYRRAADGVRASDPGCHLPVALLAGIGRVESHHARRGNVDASGTTLAPILGPRLDGQPGVAAIRDTDGGRYDGDTEWDRAVGAMQFIPGTWKRWKADGNGDSIASPHNVYDATLAAGRYLCAGDRDLRDAGDLRAAILSYNHSSRYVNIVLAWMRVYSGGTTAVPDQPVGHRSGDREETAPSSGQTGRRDSDATGPRSRPTPPSTPPQPPPSGDMPTQPPLPRPTVPAVPTAAPAPPPDPESALPGVAGQATP